MGPEDDEEHIFGGESEPDSGEEFNAECAEDAEETHPWERVGSGWISRDATTRGSERPATNRCR